MSIAHPDSARTSLETTAQKAVYQQAIDDFSITNLLAQLQNFSSPEFVSQPIAESESELIASLLVEQLANNLGSQLVAAYLKAIRRGNQEVLPEPISLQYPQSTELPADFPTSASCPRFMDGDYLRLHSIPIDGEAQTETDVGRCIGRYFAYAPHHCQWMWKYVVWLDRDSISASWCSATTAWEDELELVTQRELA